MEENTNQQQKKGISKGIIAIIVGVIVLIGGTAAAFFINSSSPKATYFLAEKNSLDHVKDYVEDRYADELAWMETAAEGATAQNVDMGITIQDQVAGGFETDPALEMVNNARLMFNVETDMEARQFYTNAGINLSGMEVNDIEFAVNEGTLFLGLPFLSETLQFNDEDYGRLMYEMDPYTFTGNETLNLDQILFDNIYQLEEEDLEYLQEEYGQFVYDLLPEDAFESTNEDVEVNGESISAEKVTMHLTEDQAREVLVSLFEKMRDDERLKELVHAQLMDFSYMMGSDMAQLEEEINTILEDYETAFDEGIAALETFQFGDGITSNLWVADDKVVQRDFNISFAPEGEELLTLELTGDQLFTDEQVYFDFEFVVDEDTANTLNISGDLNSNDGEVTDNIEFSIAEMTLYYEGEESVNDGTRTYDRTFGFNEPMMGDMNMVWSGESTYEEDQMNSSDTLTFGMTDMPEVFAIDFQAEGSVIDSVTEVDTSDVVDIGNMSAEELTTYFNTDFAEQFQGWLMQFMGGSNFGF